MSTQNFAVITAAQRTALMAFNGEDVAINPMAVTNTSPGVGININPDADGFDGGDVITLVGNYVAPKRIVDDPDYLTHASGMVALLLTLPWAMLETETIFAPVSED
jgi:hypothetical protein